MLDEALKVIDRIISFIPNPKEAQEAKLTAERALREAFFKAEQAQIETNKEQAKHDSLFVAGARPAAMWVCVFGFAWQFVFQPILLWALAIYGSPIDLPQIDTGPLITLLFGLLGLGGYRTYEKLQGVARNNLQLKTKSNTDYNT